MLISLILFQVVIFAGLIFFLRQILTKDVRRATQHLRQREEEYAKKEAKLKKRLEESQAYYEETLKKANDEASLVKTQSLNEAQEVREKTLEAARTQSEEVIQRANMTADQIKKELTVEMEQKTLEAACKLVQEALPKSLQKLVHVQWTEELLSGEMAALERMHLSGGTKEVEVRTAFPLTPEQKARLKKKLKECTKKELELKEVSDPSVVAGWVILLGGIVLDGSLANRIQEVARQNKS